MDEIIFPDTKDILCERAVTLAALATMMDELKDKKSRQYVYRMMDTLAQSITIPKPKAELREIK